MLLPPPVMSYVVPLLGQCGLVIWYSVHCRIARCGIHVIFIWSYVDHGSLYPACLGVSSVCFGLYSLSIVAFSHHFSTFCHHVSSISGLLIALATLDALCWVIPKMVLYVLDVAHSTKVSPLSQFGITLPVAISQGIYSFPYLYIEVAHHYHVVFWSP